jgi:hypothetical protein
MEGTMKLVLCAGAALAFATTAAFAADQFAGMYGNTLNLKNSDGSTMAIYINADHTWEQHAPDGKIVRGTYSWTDETHFCAVMTDPAPGPDDKPDCHEMSGNHKPGDSWTMTEGDDTTTMSITPGR